MAPQRAPQRPVLDLEESKAEEEPFELDQGMSAEPAPAPSPTYDAELRSSGKPATSDYDDSEDEEGPLMKPAGLSPSGAGDDYGDEDEDYDDVDWSF